ncbi:hypothetical protein B6N13_20780 [Marinomonas sp. UCMA 3892]|nr:hypothetical protein [Marinomonas sp. UCMA 3892]
MLVSSENEILLPSEPLTAEQKLWLISLSSFLSLPNSYSLDSLENKSEKYTPEAIIAGNSKVLKNSYGINDKNEFIDTLDIFCGTARSQEFMYLMKEWAKPDLYAKRLFGNPHKYKGTEVEIASVWAEKYRTPLSHCGIQAFDIGRYAFLCRCAYTVSLITEDEAWAFLLRIGKIAQECFTSWYEFATSYTVGRCIWLDINIDGIESTENTFDVLEKIQTESEELEKILADHKHPWSILGWEISF